MLMMLTVSGLVRTTLVVVSTKLECNVGEMTCICITHISLIMRMLCSTDVLNQSIKRAMATLYPTTIQVNVFGLCRALSAQRMTDMLTIAEAMQRAAINGLVIRRAKPPLSLAWCVTLIEDKNDDNAYITDDLEDAVLMGAIMRSKRHQLVVGAFRL